MVQQSSIMRASCQTLTLSVAIKRSNFQDAGYRSVAETARWWLLHKVWEGSHDRHTRCTRTKGNREPKDGHGLRNPPYRRHSVSSDIRNWNHVWKMCEKRRQWQACIRAATCWTHRRNVTSELLSWEGAEVQKSIRRCILVQIFCCCQRKIGKMKF